MNSEENNIVTDQPDHETQKVDIELELEKMSIISENTVKEPEIDNLGSSTLDLISPEINSAVAKKPKVIGNTRDIVREIQGIEVLLGTKTKGLYAKTRTEVEIILDQRKAQLEEKNRVDNAPELKDDIFSQVKQPEEILQEPASTDDSNVEKLDFSPAKKPPVVHKKKPGKKVIAENPLDKANADMLFRMNLLFLFSVETISEKYADQLNTSFTGVSKKMASDYDRDDYLKGIYKRVYQENKEMIQTYASPLSELALYNASVLGTFAATNLDKSIKKSN